MDVHSLFVSLLFHTISSNKFVTICPFPPYRLLLCAALVCFFLGGNEALMFFEVTRNRVRKQGPKAGQEVRPLLGHRILSAEVTAVKNSGTKRPRER